MVKQYLYSDFTICVCFFMFSDHNFMVSKKTTVAVGKKI